MADNKKGGFSKPPIMTDKERERFERKFVEGSLPSDSSTDEDDIEELESEKVKTHSVLIRVPLPAYKKLLLVKKKTGLTMNGVCLDLLWTALKLKLKDLDVE